MTQELPDDHITKKTVVLRLPAMDEVRVRRDLEYARDGSGPLLFDLYTPPDETDSGPRPVVLSVAGYSDPGVERILGCRTKEMGSSTSWGRLIAASGMAAVTYTNREPAEDIRGILRHLGGHAADLGIDPSRIGLLATSGHGPLAVATLMDDRSNRPVRCAAFFCPLLLDLDGANAVADAAKTFRFTNPAAGRTVEDLPADIALFIARAGRDEIPGLNDALDRFVEKALSRNLPLTLVNVPMAPHAFELQHDQETSREAVRAALRFLRFHLQERA